MDEEGFRIERGGIWEGHHIGCLYRAGFCGGVNRVLKFVKTLFRITTW